MFYCPAGTTERLNVTDNYYTTPTDADFTLRQGELPCGLTNVCYQGISSPKITWGAGSCDALTVPENLAAPYTSRQLAVVINPDLDQSKFTVEYSLLWWGFTSDFVIASGCSRTACDPNDPSNVGTAYNAYYGQNLTLANAGIFDVDPVNGYLLVTRYAFPDWLNYETCRCPGLQYNMTVQVTATDTVGPNVVNCTFLVSIEDQNDQPLWPPEVPGGDVSYRAVVEQSPINAAIVGCDESSYYGFNTTYFGCPFVAPGQDVFLFAWDEDFNSNIRYSISSANYGLSSLDPSVDPFVINSCTALISMALSDSIFYWQLPQLDSNGARFYNLTITVMDDGNGGRFAPLSANHMVVIFVIKVSPRSTHVYASHASYQFSNV